VANLVIAEANRLLDLSVVDDNVYLALVSSVPTAAAAGAELAGGNYARQPISAAAAAAGAKANDTQILFPVANADWLNIVGWEVWDALVAGNRRWFLALAAADQRLVKNGDQYRVPVADLAFALA
jgi:hypothetical protein